MNNNEIRRRRREILYQISRLDETRCADCQTEPSEAAETIGRNYICGCPSATAIRELGIQLDALLPKRVDFVQQYLDELPDELTPELYKEIRSKLFDGSRVTDVAIRKRFGWRPTPFNQWKERNNLVKERTK